MYLMLFIIIVLIMIFIIYVIGYFLFAPLVRPYTTMPSFVTQIINIHTKDNNLYILWRHGWQVQSLEVLDNPRARFTLTIEGQGMASVQSVYSKKYIGSCEGKVKAYTHINPDTTLYFTFVPDNTEICYISGVDGYLAFSDNLYFTKDITRATLWVVTAAPVPVRIGA